jgi:hypothetical protein
MRPLDDRQSDPTGGQHAPELTVGEERDLALHGPKTSNKSVGAVRDLSGTFASGATVSKDIPIRSLLAYVDATPAFIIAIIPLGEVRFDLRLLPRYHQCTRSLCAPTGTAKYVGEFCESQSLPQLACLILAMLGQRNICSPGVLMG